MTVRPSVFLALLLIVLGRSLEVQAQTVHAAPQAVLDAAVHEHVDAIAADREAILRVLGRSEVKAIANRAGIDLRGREAAVSTLRGEELTRVAALARQAEDRLVGGATRSQYFFYYLGLAIVPLILVLVWAL